MDKDLKETTKKKTSKMQSARSYGQYLEAVVKKIVIEHDCKHKLVGNVKFNY